MSEDDLKEFNEQTVIKMQELLFNNTLDEANHYYYQYCLQRSGQKAAEDIRGVDFGEFRKEIKLNLDSIINIRIPKLLPYKPIKAVCYEYDSGYDWSGSFVLCHRYLPLAEKDNDWACCWDKFIDNVNTPFYIPDIDSADDDENDEGLGVNIYSNARVVIEFATVCQTITPPVPICIYHHEQNEITRIFPDSMFEH